MAAETNGRAAVDTANGIDDACRFLATIFDAGDVISLRPVEAWLDRQTGNKVSAVDYKHIASVVANPTLILVAIRKQIAAAESSRANVFYGVCPRFGPGAYEKAWQIRTVRVLWADVDGATVDEVLERVKAAGLPEPSIVVSSGNGAHLYWLLDVPYLIDDVPDPVPVDVEWTEDAGKRKRREFILDDTGEKLYLDVRSNVPPLSEKTQHLQDVLKGIAANIGGDHTTDVSRLLRVPGTLNRKDQRNGREPVPCKLVTHDADRRYAFETFERFAAQSPDKARREKLAKVRLPAARKLSAKRQDRLHELILACDAAPVGQRSQADYAFCAYAIEQGIGRDEAWQHVANVGKFAEAGERYFDRTWNAAAEATREKIFEKVERKATRKAASSNGTTRVPPLEGEHSADELDDCEVPHITTDEGRTELSNARRFAYLHGQSMRYVDTWSKFLHWNGRQWQPDAERIVETKAKGVCAFLRKQLASVALSMEEKDLATATRFITASESYRGLMAAIALVKSETNIPVRVEALDADPWSFNCLNGTIDLRTGELRPHDRDDLLTKLCPTPYIPDAVCPLWEHTLAELLPTDVIDFLRRALGYTITGVVREHVLLFLYGHGANGKSTFLNTAAEVIGTDYATTAAPELLMMKKGESHPTERADLHGRRFITAIETEEGRHWAESLIKALTGSDPVKGRRMREDFWEFQPTHTLWLSGNHKPSVRGTDHGIWRRIKLVPFLRQIPDDQQDKELPEKLRAEAAGILAWIVRGCLEWQAHGLGEPDAVREATACYRSEMDVIGRFLDEHCLTGSLAFHVRAKDLFASFRSWCETSSEHGMNQTRFGMALVERGYTKRTSNGVWYDGLALRGDES